MNCLICNTSSHYFFTKQFNCFGLKNVDYYRCNHCGSVFAKTLLELAEEEWQTLCSEYHSSYRDSGNNPDDPNWLQRLNHQGETLLSLTDLGILSKSEKWLDYGCGDGELGAFLEKAGIAVDCYDRYWKKPTYVHSSKLIPGSYPLVINTSLFEHLRDQSTMDTIIELITHDGVFALHTLVRGDIPRDPNWFYLLPVHTLFFTNKAMKILFNKWGFSCSLYAVDARLWLWFRQPLAAMLKKHPELDKPNQWQISEGFMAYWP
ncbi:MAG: class I SAM-dependent methyltransferase [Candidatus Thiodiazotropha sp. LLP2]